MDIRIGDMPRVKNELSGDGRSAGQQVSRRERRKNRQDRRKSVRDGVFVRLSFKHDRRQASDRRKQNSTYDRLGQ